MTLLRQWIQGALENGNKPLTEEYFASSLRIAIFLTEQITDAEELADVGLSSGLDSIPPPFPKTCVDWSNCISVDLSSSGELDPLPLNPDPDETSLFEEGASVQYDLQNEDLNILLNVFSGGREGTFDGCASGQLNYHSINGAQICFRDNQGLSASNNSDDAKRDKQHRIYSLGLAFWELFSGGDLPPPELLVVSSQDGGGLTAISVSNTAGVDDDSSYALRDAQSNKRQSSITSISSSLNTSRGSISSSHARSQVICNVDVEYLRMKSVPAPLCELVRSMIDCINGEFMLNESYCEISDVTCDLKLMLEQPSIFLKGVDANRLSHTGLQLNNSFFEWGAEFNSLRSTFHRAQSGSLELAVIAGSSGTGKSTLARRFGDYLTANGGHFISAKFDQMKQAMPFSEVALALNEYCEILTREEESNRASLVAYKLRSVLGQDVNYLCQILPSLSKILTDLDSHTIPSEQQDCANAQQRLLYLLCKFTEVICSCSKGPIVVFVDDVQWADKDSISTIGQIILRTACSPNDNNIKHQLFFLGCCRDDEITSDHPFWDMIERARTLGFNDTKINLDCLDSDEVKQALSNSLHLSPRLVKGLAEIVHHKTKGNLLFVTRLLLDLNRVGLLRINLARQRWDWDEDAIQEKKLTDDVASFFVQRIDSLLPDARMALGALSCFGASVSCEIVEALEIPLGIKLAEPLQILVDEGLVYKREGRYIFCHDRIQEAAYTMIDEQECCIHHMNYGLCLVDLALQNGNSALLLTAVTQINIGGPAAVQNKGLYSLIANYNLIAGKKAMECSDFASAFRFFDHGITFLRKKHWQESYALSLELCTLGAKCALAIKDMSSVAILCDSVARYAVTFEDSLEASFITMTSLIHSKISDSVAYAISTLIKLGVSIPQLPSRELILQQMDGTQLMLNAMSDEAILDFHTMSDYKTVMTMKFLARLNFAVQMVKPGMLPLVTIKMVKFSLENGLSPMSAVGFAYFGGILAGLGDLRGGYRFTKLATALLNKFCNNEFAGEVFCLTTGILSFIEPYQVVNEELEKGPIISMAAGDVHWACVNKLVSSSCLLWTGVKLPLLKKTFSDTERFMEEHNHLTTVYFMKTFQRTVSRLLGDESKTLNDDEMSKVLAQYKNPLQLVIFYVHNTFVALIFNNCHDIKENGEKFTKLEYRPWLLIASDAFQAFVIGLASFRIYRETQDPLWLEKAKDFQERIFSWSEQGSSWNFEHRSNLMLAEEAFSCGNYKKAGELYDNAILLARRSKLLLDEALASELAARFHLNVGNKSSAFDYYSTAFKKYMEWGALAKVTKLNAFAQETFGVGFPSESFSNNAGWPIDSRKREAAA